MLVAAQTNFRDSPPHIWCLSEAVADASSFKCQLG